MCEEKFTSPKTGNKFTIYIDDSGEEISVFSEESKVGSISLSLTYGEYKYKDCFHITNLSLDKCQGQGVGRRCLQFHIENFDGLLTAASHDGNRRDDGSHLTGAGFPFIQQMRSEKIVCPDSEYEQDFYDDE